jgi:hypothetical protein
VKEAGEAFTQHIVVGEHHTELPTVLRSRFECLTVTARPDYRPCGGPLSAVTTACCRADPSAALHAAMQLPDDRCSG